MRRLIALLLIGTLLLPASLAGAAMDLPITVLLNGQPLTFDVPPRNEDGRILVPMRAIFEALGAAVGWDSANHAATAVRGSTVVYLRIGAGWAYVDGKGVVLDVPAGIRDSRTLVPLRFVAEALGATVGWDGTNRVVTITLAGSAPAPSVAPGAVPAPMLPGYQRECIEGKIGVAARAAIERGDRAATDDEKAVLRSCIVVDNPPAPGPGGQPGPVAHSRPWPAATTPAVSLPLTINGDIPGGKDAAQAAWAHYFPYLVKYLGMPLHFRTMTWNWLDSITDPGQVGWDYQTESIHLGPVPSLFQPAPGRMPDWRIYWQSLHETGHLFYGLGDQVIRFQAGQWLWEGHSLIAQALTNLELGESVDDLDTYDILNNLGPNRVNGVHVDGYKYNRTIDNFAATKALQMLTEVLSADTNLDFMRRVNAGLLAEYQASGNSYISNETYARILNEAAGGRTIDGKSPGDWLFAQAVANINGAPGNFLVAYPQMIYRADSNYYPFNVAAFTRTPSRDHPQDLAETGFAGLNVTLSITDATGKVLAQSTAVTANDGTVIYDMGRSLNSLPAGAYLVTASAEVQGQTLTATNLFVLLAPHSSDVAAADDRFLIIPMNGDGTRLRPELVDQLQVKGGVRQSGENGVLMLAADPGSSVELSLPNGFRAVVSKPVGARAVPLRVPDASGNP